MMTPDEIRRRWSSGHKMTEGAAVAIKEYLEQVGVKDLRGLGKIGISVGSFAACLRCNTPWPFVNNHATKFEEGRGIFPLCEECWSELTPEQRVPYYKMLHDLWVSDAMGWSGSDQERANWALIEAAVLAGL